ncbi:MAG: hypothetical protein QF790_04355 [Gammaproteobacteria bacterium]|nr:hypothetical protein [Gammaproteobacteria bacterium]MDP6616380.1 hypothetical protein [Gammaproteobacteria bacterium]MDP6695710.1 hypothetical protein [Gammaproteobacteria bacterium]MDP7041113.1 hypothetical protein [Gammaproteobacteria bacterium]
MTLIRYLVIFSISLAAMLGLLACGSSSLQQPGGSSGSSVPSAGSGSIGFPGSSGGIGAGSSVPSGPSGSVGGIGAGTGGSSPGLPGLPGIPGGSGTGDPDGAFDKSLGEFDGAMKGEQGAIASTGGGSTRGAERRESGDASTSSSGSGTSGAGSIPNIPAADSGSEAGGSTGGEAGGGRGTVGGEEKREGGDFEESGRDGQNVANIPEDIPIDGSGDDLVGRQIREAAIAMEEVDPKAAEALWEEYRKHTGLK